MKDFDFDSEKDLESIARYYEETDTSDLVGEEVQIETSRRPMVSRSIRLDRGTMDELKKIADAKGVGVTQLMRGWILDRLALEHSSHGARDFQQKILLRTALESVLTEQDVEGRDIGHHLASLLSAASVAAVQRRVLPSASAPSASVISNATAVRVRAERAAPRQHTNEGLRILAWHHAHPRALRDL